MSKYKKIICPECDGIGSVGRVQEMDGGAGEVTCTDCNGAGFLEGVVVKNETSN